MENTNKLLVFSILFISNNYVFLGKPIQYWTFELPRYHNKISDNIKRR